MLPSEDELARAASEARFRCSTSTRRRARAPGRSRLISGHETARAERRPVHAHRSVKTSACSRHPPCKTLHRPCDDPRQRAVPGLRTPTASNPSSLLINANISRLQVPLVPLRATPTTGRARRVRAIERSILEHFTRITSRGGGRLDEWSAPGGGSFMRVARVLLVEDNPIMCRLVCAALDAEDLHITQAHTGAQALSLWADSA